MIFTRLNITYFYILYKTIVTDYYSHPSAYKFKRFRTTHFEIQIRFIYIFKKNIGL